MGDIRNFAPLLGLFFRSGWPGGGAVLNTALTFVSLAARDLSGSRSTRDWSDSSHRRSSLEAHMRAAEEWLKRAHDQGTDDGVSYGYSIRGGWRPSYLETSGYIANTFFRLAKYHNDPSWKERAVRICRWLLSVQNKDGSFSNPRFGDAGIVFDTGQDLRGLVEAFEETGDPAFLEGAGRAADWLVQVADENGCWTRNEYLNTPHVYNTRTAWSLLYANSVDYSDKRERIARANLDWAMSVQHSTGFFENCAFKYGSVPFTHTIAYTARGLIESGDLLNEVRYREAGKRCADSTLAHLRDDGFLPGEITIDGKPAASYCCLTGNCQFAVIWAKLFDVTGNEQYRQAAIRATDYVMSCQDIHTANLNVRGAIKGSHPIYGSYAPLSYPNWAAKFFVDALLQRIRWSQ